MTVTFVLLLGCGKAPTPPSAGVDVVDFRGKTVRVPTAPRRIVSIVPSATELLFAAGAADQVAGVTTYCEWPPEARAKPKIGSISLDYEALAAIKPDLVVTSWAVTRKTTADVESQGYAVYSVDPHTFEDVARALRELGRITGHAAEGERAAKALEERVAAVKVAADGPTFYFEHSADPLGSTGPGSYAGECLRRAGGRNIFDGAWRMIDWESVMQADPEVILIGHDKKEGVERRAGWAGLRAVKGGRVHFVPKEAFVYPTPRLVDGLVIAAKLFHAKTP